MKRLLTFWLVLAFLGVSHAQVPLVYPLKHAASGFDTYKDALYYYDAGNTYNLRNFVISKSDSIIDFKVSPDGSTMAIATVDRRSDKTSISSYKLWEYDNRIAAKKDLSYRPVAICYDASGKRLCVAGKDKAIRQLDVNTLQELSKSFVGFVASSVTSSSINQIASVHGNTVNVRRIAGMNQLAKLIYNTPINKVAFSADGLQMAVLTNNSKLTVYETDQFKEKLKINALGQAIDCAFNPDGKHIAIVTTPNTIEVINLLNNDREIIENSEGGISFVRFVVDPMSSVPYLIYNTTGHIYYQDMSQLSPYRLYQIANILQEKMSAWKQILPDETEEAYQLRVNDQTYNMHKQVLEQDITNKIALEQIGEPQIRLMRYNPELRLLALSLDKGVNDIFLEMTANDVISFKDSASLEFKNLKYGLDEQDEFILLYADVYNKTTGETYVYDNLEGQFEDLQCDDDVFVSLEVIEKSVKDKTQLDKIKDDIFLTAKEQNILSDHTHFEVSTNVVNTKTEAGQNMRSYEVSISYTVDDEYSAKEDYGAGKYELKDSPAAGIMMDIIQKTLAGEFSKYLVSGKPVLITLYGTADATPIKGRIAYNGCYGYFDKEPIMYDGEPSYVTISKGVRRTVSQSDGTQPTYNVWPAMGGASTATVVVGGGITTNEQLAFLRAVGVGKALFSMLPALDQMDTEIKYDINVSKQIGSEYRKVGVKLVFEDVF